ncbi:MAG: HIT domain-containing protein [bacterium]|nr:HIT domain-containing protein [bacterium]
MDHLYTPWRMAYIKGEKKPVQGCVFCSLVQQQPDTQIIARLTHVFVTLNLYPYNNGHVMVIPYEHVDSQEKLPEAALTELIVTINKAMAVLRHAYQATAFNLGANIGAPAGAGIAEHYHFHVVPRWGGDANFMTTIGSTRVIPDTLDNTFRDLSTAWRTLYGLPEGERSKHGDNAE